MLSNDGDRTESMTLRFLSFAALVAAAAIVSCTTEDVDWAADAGAGGAAVRPDGRGAGGSTTTGGGPPPTMCPTGPPPSWCDMPVPVPTGFIADFMGPAGGSPTVFGLYGAPIWGGVYAYPPAVPDPCTDAGPPSYPILSEMRDNQWRVTGTLGTYSGFGLWWNCTAGGNIYPVCVIDASAFSAIQFSIQGDPGPSGTLLFQMRTADNAPPAADPTSSSCGACTAACAFAAKSIPVTTARSTVTIPWTELAGGVPHPFDPHHVTGIEWQFSYSGTGSFPIDLFIDDIQLVR
jgi:hypothetical protein